MKLNRITMTAFLVMLLLMLVGGYQVATAQDAPVNEAAQWQFTTAAGFGNVPVHWDISYRVYDSEKWAGWVDGFYAPSDDTLGGGLSAQYKPIKLPIIDAVGAGVLYNGKDFRPTVYFKKTIASF